MRENRTLVDVLTMYADGLNAGQDMADEYVRAFPEYAPDLVAFLGIARRLKQALAPVRPTPAFRQSLHTNLIEARQHRLVPRITIQNPFRRQRIVFISAAIGSVVSVTIGIIAALLIRNRAIHRTTGVPSA